MPTLFTGTAACTVGLWFYLNQTPVDIPLRYTRSSTPTFIVNDSSSRESLRSTPTVEKSHSVLNPIDVVIPSVPAARGSLQSAFSRIESNLSLRGLVLANLAEQFDRESVRWRSNISRDTRLASLVAWAFYHAGDVTTADRVFQYALSVDADYAPALSGRAHIHMEQGNVKQAIDAFRQICTANPNDTGARYNLGVLLTRTNRYTEAANEYRRALAIDPNHTRSLYNLASLAQRDGRLAEARDLWERFVRIEPNVISVWFNLGVVHMDFDDPFAAAHCFAAAATINPDELINQLNLSMALIEAGQIETAHEILAKAIADHPCNPELLDILADAKRRIADWYPQQRYAFLAECRALEATVADINADHQQMESRLAGDAMSSEAAGMIGP